jgi:hypothetical protein
LQFGWIDICCINNSHKKETEINQAIKKEHDEAINSMYKWFERAEVCYAYLEDVNIDSVGKLEREGRAMVLIDSALRERRRGRGCYLGYPNSMRDATCHLTLEGGGSLAATNRFRSRLGSLAQRRAASLAFVALVHQRMDLDRIDCPTARGILPGKLEKVWNQERYARNPFKDHWDTAGNPDRFKKSE